MHNSTHLSGSSLFYILSSHLAKDIVWLKAFYSFLAHIFYFSLKGLSWKEKEILLEFGLWTYSMSYIVSCNLTQLIVFFCCTRVVSLFQKHLPVFCLIGFVGSFFVFVSVFNNFLKWQCQPLDYLFNCSPSFFTVCLCF